MSRASVGFLVCVLAGCGGGCSGGSSNENGESSGGGGSSQGGESSGGEPTVHETGPPPNLLLTVEVGHDQQVSLRVANRGESAQLNRTFMIQRQSGESWETVEEVNLSLRYNCESTPDDDCVTLTTGAEFIPPPWLGSIGDAQCACERCRPAPDGTYRFAVQSCQRGHTIHSDPFVLE